MIYCATRTGSHSPGWTGTPSALASRMPRSSSAAGTMFHRSMACLGRRWAASWDGEHRLPPAQRRQHPRLRYRPPAARSRRVFGFPVFKRHYSGSFSQFALALFLGRPRFSSNITILSQRTGWIEPCPQLTPGMPHRPLVFTPRDYNDHASPPAGIGHIYRIRFFTNRFRFDSTKDSSRSFVCVNVSTNLLRYAVLVDGVEVPSRSSLNF